MVEAVAEEEPMAEAVEEEGAEEMEEGEVIIIQ